MNKKIVLVGLGPHAKRIYLTLLSKYHILPKLVVDLDSNKENVIDYLNSQHIKCDTYFVKNDEADYQELSMDVKADLKKYINKYHLDYAIISTEPKAHFAYAKFFLKNNLNILMDKPITVPLFVFKDKNYLKINQEYQVLKKYYLKKDHNFVIQCQRRYHDGYLYVKELIRKTIKEYGVPITYLDVYHCDGMWNMPNEFFERENHPYKYGYGKLFHSGYHFVDLITWLLECNNLTNKKMNKLVIKSSTYQPSDFFNNLDNDFYQKVFKTNAFHDLLCHKDQVKDFGELDFHAMMDFMADNYVVTHCNMNLLQSGFSKRSWLALPDDTYKGNGRVRHEMINIQIGPIMNIQVHSYQAFEVKDNKITNYDVGSTDHFDIYIFRNNKLIGGEPFTKVSIKELMKNNDFLGNNEKAREKCFLEFINDQKGSSDLLMHEKSIYLLTKLCESVAKKKDIKCDWVNDNE